MFDSDRWTRVTDLALLPELQTAYDALDPDEQTREDQAIASVADNDLRSRIEAGARTAIDHAIKAEATADPGGSGEPDLGSAEPDGPGDGRSQFQASGGDAAPADMV